MSVVRSLERRLERLMEGVAGKIFSGRLHPSELAGKLAREADLARFDHPSGPATANHYVIEVNQKDLNMDPEELSTMLAAEVFDYTIEEGLRLEGPVSVTVETTDQVSPGSANVHVEVKPGIISTWSRLVSTGATMDITYNRTLLGRSADMDIALDDASISRRHALIWRKNGQTWIQDLDSSNGTKLDGKPLGQDPALLVSGSVLAFGQSKYRFVEQ
ncbi:MAG: FhaA domain-containing protein [Actinomycetota bacterium]|nr:FhaA domain-containing protein [Actinomycetota bacterium]